MAAFQRSPRGPLRGQECQKPPRIGGSRAFLVVIEIDEDAMPAPRPEPDPPGPISERFVAVVTLVVAARSMAPHVDVAGGRDPRCRSMMVVRDAERHSLLAQQ